jgi:hypothetical protein
LTPTANIQRYRKTFKIEMSSRHFRQGCAPCGTPRRNNAEIAQF